MTREREVRLTRRLLVGSLGTSLALALPLALVDQAPSALPLALLLALALLLLALARRAARGGGVEGFLSLGVLNLLLVTPELALRLAGFQRESGIQFGYPRPHDFQHLEPDPLLFWRLSPSVPNANSEGFPGPEFTIPKPAGEFRVLYLGDSCAQQGDPAYPELVDELLQARRGGEGPTFRSVSLAVPGFSSHQGRLAARLFADRLQPDLAVVAFGWNDHWLAYGARDSKKRISDSPAARLVLALHRLRLVQALFGLREQLTGGPAPPLDEVRVTEDEYRANLTALRAHFQRAGIPVVFLTAPSLHARHGVSPFLVEKGFARDAPSVVELHRRYNEIVRSVARAPGSWLLDLERQVDALPEPELLRVFREDGIHFKPSGLALVARRLARFLEARRLVPPPARAGAGRARNRERRLRASSLAHPSPARRRRKAEQVERVTRPLTASIPRPLPQLPAVRNTRSRTRGRSPWRRNPCWWWPSRTSSTTSACAS